MRVEDASWGTGYVSLESGRGRDAHWRSLLESTGPPSPDRPPAGSMGGPRWIPVRIAAASRPPGDRRAGARMNAGSPLHGLRAARTWALGAIVVCLLPSCRQDQPTAPQ